MHKSRTRARRSTRAARLMDEVVHNRALLYRVLRVLRGIRGMLESGAPADPQKLKAISDAIAAQSGETKAALERNAP